MSDLSAASAAPLVIPIACFVAHRDVAEMINAGLAPLYTFVTITTSIPELEAAIAIIHKMEPITQPRAWIVGGMWDQADQAEKLIHHQVGWSEIPVLKVPKGTMESIGGPSMVAYTTGMLDGVLKQ